MTDECPPRLMSRRNFLATSAKAAVGLSLLYPLDILAKPTPNIPVLRDSKKTPPQPILLINTHTQEEFRLQPFGSNFPSTVRNHLYSFLRDHRTGDVHPIDLRLMEILQQIQKKTGSKGAYEVISAYRSPRTNHLLRGKSSGVAKNSLHVTGRAIDIRLTDLPTRHLRDVAISLKAGGVGYYPSSDFVHIDTGKVRTW